MKTRVAATALACILALGGLFLAAKALMPEPAMIPEQPAAVRASNVFSLSNEERSDQGVPQLSLNPLLMRAAQLKAEDMAKESYYAHVSPDGETPMHWLDQVGYKYQYVGENLTANILEDEAVVSAWMGSPGHRRNLLDPKFEHMGVGVAEGTYKGKPALFVAQILATPKPVALPPSPKPATVPAKPKAPIPPPKPKPVETPKPPSPPKTITETAIVRDVTELTKPLTEPIASSSVSLFSTTTAPVPFVISTSAIPIELRSTSSAELPEPAAMHEAGKRASQSWLEGVSGFFEGTFIRIRSLFGS